MGEILSVIIWNVLWFSGAVVLQYYLQLFRDRSEFYRDELIGLERFMDFGRSLVFRSGKPLADIGVLLAGVFCAWIFSLLGVLTPGERSSSYLFHSPLFFLAMLFGYKPIIQILQNKASSSLLQALETGEVPFMLGLGVTSITMPMAVFFMNAHNPATISFLWVIANFLACVILLEIWLYRQLVQPEPPVQEDFPAENEESGPVSDPEPISDENLEL